MSLGQNTAARRRRALAAIVLACVIAAVVVVLAPAGAPVQVARAAPSPSEPTSGDVFQPQIGLPANDVTVFGAAPDAGDSGEAWAFGQTGDVPPAADTSLLPTEVGGNTFQSPPTVLLERTDAGGWQTVPFASGANDPEVGSFAYGAQSGRVTPDGGVAAFTEGDDGTPDLFTINPGASGAGPQEAPQPSLPDASAQTLLPSVVSAQTIPFAAIDEGDGDTGVLIAPQDDGADKTTPVVLHYDGSSWTQETIVVTSGQSVTPDALACGPTASAPTTDSPDNCWLLATVTDSTDPAGALELFGRVSDGTSYSWVPQTVTSGPLATPGSAAALGIAQSAGETPGGGAQMLTVTSQGIWVDFSTSSDTVDDSEFVQEPAGSSGSGGATPSLAPASSAGTWCFPYSVSACQGSLGEMLPVSTSSSSTDEGYLSFAWPSATGSGPGERVITGGLDGQLLEFSGAGSYSEQVGTGDDASGSARTGAAFASPTQGWISDPGEASEDVDGQGVPQVENVLAPGSPTGDELSSDPVPFDQPLLAVASAPGVTPGDPNGSAIAVGYHGQTAIYVPGAGWTPYALLNGAGQTQIPNLRAVAWPEPGRAYAVGDNGAMWLFQTSTEQWEPDPAKPFNFDGNLTGIAFDPDNPDLGYAVGKGGTILQFGKSWTPVALTGQLATANFTSVAFAGQTAYATFRTVDPNYINGNQAIETGGLAVNTGSGWTVDSGATAVLSALPNKQDEVLSKVAGLPDGGAVAAGPGVVIELPEAGDSWELSPQPLPEAANISALAAFRQSDGAIGAIASIDVNAALDPNQPSPDGLMDQSPISPGYEGEVPFPGLGPNSPPPLVPPDPIPDSGYLLEQSAAGSWVDMEHETFPTDEQGPAGGLNNEDVPVRPDPVLGLSVAPDGSEGLAVGGQTGDSKGSSSPNTDDQTGAVMRFGAGAASQTQTGTATLTTDPTQANFVLGGDATCAQLCAGEAGLSLAPDVSLAHAVSQAGQIQGVRAFLYSGGRLPAGVAGGLTDPLLTSELDREGQVISGSAGSLPVYVTPSSDIVNSDGLFPLASSGLIPFVPGPQGTLGAGALSAAGTGYYAFTSTGASGPVMVIVLDFSAGDTIGETQLAWLSAELATAKGRGEPAIVMGADSLGFSLPNADNDDQTQGVTVAGDGQAVADAIIAGGASAYLFDYPQANVQTTLSDGTSSIPAFGSGTLGYVQAPDARETDALGSSATLVVSVQTAERNPQTDVAPVTATAIPNIGQLAMDATNGTLLRRSQVALFDGLARRPAEGTEWTTAGTNGGPAQFDGPEPYDPIPSDCSGADCTYQIPEQFSFTSSNPSVGNFVEHDANSSNPLAVALGKNQLPVADPSSGLFCAFNSGTTTATLTAGGLTYSLPVTVEAGSVEYPCGTVPDNIVAPSGAVGVKVPGINPIQPRLHPRVHPRIHPKIPAPHHHHVTTPVPRPTPSPTPAPKHAPRPVHHVKPVPVRHHPLPKLPHVQASSGLLPVIAPAPPPPVPRPVPPSGTSQVPSNSSVAENVPMAQREREKLAATQGVDAMAAHDPDGGLPIPAWTIGLLVLAAAAGGAGIRRRGRGGAPYAWIGDVPRAGAQARPRTWRRQTPGQWRR